MIIIHHFWFSSFEKKWQF